MDIGMCDTLTKLFSTAEIAAAMGVGESSIKRWIDAGTLAAEKTPGGHRRVALTDFYNFLRATGKKLVAPEAVGLHSGPAFGTKTPMEVCQTSLRTGDAFTFESALRLLRLSEPTVASILDNTVYTAFRAVRATCLHPSEECLILHRAISIAQSSLRITMAPTETTLSENSPRIVLADVGYEVDGIPTFFAEAAVWDQANCLQLGTNVPSKVVEGAIETFEADVLWLSASGPGRRSAISNDFQTILKKANRSGVKVVVFGDAVPRLGEISATHATSFSEFRGFIAALR
jgi:excisionase family DNA binding protein